MNNLEFWEKVEKTDPSMTQKVAYGDYKYTAISAMYQIKNLTSTFGMCGIGWGIKDDRFELIDTDHEKLLIYQGIFWYKYKDNTGEIPIASAIQVIKGKKVKPDDDCVKKVKTDALTKGISLLGFNTDVFMGKYDDNKYIQEMNESFGRMMKTEKPKSDSKADVHKTVEICRSKIYTGFDNLGFTEDGKEEFIKKYTKSDNLYDCKDLKILNNMIEILRELWKKQQ